MGRRGCMRRCVRCRGLGMVGAVHLQLSPTIWASRGARPIHGVRHPFGKTFLMEPVAAHQEHLDFLSFQTVLADRAPVFGKRAERGMFLGTPARFSHMMLNRLSRARDLRSSVRCAETLTDIEMSLVACRTSPGTARNSSLLLYTLPLVICPKCGCVQSAQSGIRGVPRVLTSILCMAC